MGAKTTKRFFSRETEVGVDIRAGAERVWSLLTDAEGFPKWNTTVISIEGQIALGQKIRLKAKLDPKRTFTLKVRELEAPSRMVWGDAMGKRTYLVTRKDDSTVRFSMHEKIGGPLFPLFASMIPPFDAAFDQFAADLKAKAESGGQS
jgi:uncharacterized protein YndB with AHSA1/START domain